MTGVLQRIAICYGIAAVIFLLTKVRTQVILFVAILVGYWAILMYVPSPESTGGRLVDRDQPGRLPRPALSCRARSTRLITVSATTRGCSRRSRPWRLPLLGVLAGQWLLSSRGRWIKALGLAAGGARLPRAGHACGHVSFRSSRSSGPVPTS